MARFPAPAEGILVTHFIVSRDKPRHRDPLLHARSGRPPDRSRSARGADRTLIAPARERHQRGGGRRFSVI
jgi:hypothetical protein